MSYTNNAAWLDAAGSQLRIGTAESYKPGKGELIIKIRACAVNPVDRFQQTLGILVDKFPFIVGCDAAGEVVEVGEGVTRFAAGQRVLAAMNCLKGSSRAAYQEYGVALEMTTSLIPDSMSYADASVIPLALMTAGAGLYPKHMLGLALPSTTPKDTGKTLLIWGGAASVGCITIQLAVASGVKVITTASPKNFDLCKSLGASQVFDYKSDTVIEDIKAALQGHELIGVYEASGAEDSMKKASQILGDLGGGFMAPVQFQIPELPSNVKAKWLNADTWPDEDAENVRQIWQDFIPAALKSGHLKPAPPSQVVGQGLAALQTALEAWAKGVSARKIVVEL